MLSKLSKTAKMILAGSLLVLALGGAGGHYYMKEIRAEEELVDWRALCGEEADRASKLMQFRQLQFPVPVILDGYVTDYGEDLATLQIMLNLVVKAYETPIFIDPDEKARIQFSFYDYAYVQCVQRYF